MRTGCTRTEDDGGLADESEWDRRCASSGGRTNGRHDGILKGHLADLPEFHYGVDFRREIALHAETDGGRSRHALMLEFKGF